MSNTHHILNDYSLLEQVGHGSFASVHRGLALSTGVTVAIKVIPLQKLSRKLRSNLKSEIAILHSISQMRHPHVVNLINYYHNDDKESSNHTPEHPDAAVYLVTDWCALGDLSQFLRTKTKRSGGALATQDALFDLVNQIISNPSTNYDCTQFPLGGAWGGLHHTFTFFLIGQLVSALTFLRNNKIMHRDLKPQNLLLHPSPTPTFLPTAIFLTSPNKAIPRFQLFSKSYGSYLEFHNPALLILPRLPILKLADFGFARYLPSPTSLADTLCGSPLYMAPEILRYEKYDTRADLWSFGAILYELLFGRVPFRAQNHIELLRKIEKYNDRIRFPKGALPVVKPFSPLLSRSPTTFSQQRLRLAGDMFETNPLIAQSAPSSFTSPLDCINVSKPQTDHDSSQIVTEGNNNITGSKAFDPVHIATDEEDLLFSLLKHHPSDRITLEVFFSNEVVKDSMALVDVVFGWRDSRCCWSDSQGRTKLENKSCNSLSGTKVQIVSKISNSMDLPLNKSSEALLRHCENEGIMPEENMPVGGSCDTAVNCSAIHILADTNSEKLDNGRSMTAVGLTSHVSPSKVMDRGCLRSPGNKSLYHPEFLAHEPDYIIIDKDILETHHSGSIDPKFGDYIDDSHFGDSVVPSPKFDRMRPKNIEMRNEQTPFTLNGLMTKPNASALPLDEFICIIPDHIQTISDHRNWTNQLNSSKVRSLLTSKFSIPTFICFPGSDPHLTGLVAQLQSFSRQAFSLSVMMQRGMTKMHQLFGSGIPTPENELYCVQCEILGIANFALTVLMLGIQRCESFLNKWRRSVVSHVNAAVSTPSSSPIESDPIILVIYYIRELYGHIIAQAILTMQHVASRNDGVHTKGIQSVNCLIYKEAIVLTELAVHSNDYNESIYYLQIALFLLESLLLLSNHTLELSSGSDAAALEFHAPFVPMSEKDVIAVTVFVTELSNWLAHAQKNV